jgi:hypothetical protein
MRRLLLLLLLTGCATTQVQPCPEWQAVWRPRWNASGTDFVRDSAGNIVGVLDVACVHP